MNHLQTGGVARTRTALPGIIGRVDIEELFEACKAIDSSLACRSVTPAQAGVQTSADKETGYRPSPV